MARCVAAAAAVEAGDGVCGTAYHDHPVAVFLAQRLEPASLMLVTQSGGAGQQFVLDGDARAPAELRVEIPQQGVLTASGGCEVRRAVDDAVACHEHSSNCRPGSPTRLASFACRRPG